MPNSGGGWIDATLRTPYVWYHSVLVKCYNEPDAQKALLQFRHRRNHPMTKWAPQRGIILACCLGMIVQLPGVASAILACGCILPGRTACCRSLSDGSQSACCLPDAAVPSCATSGNTCPDDRFAMRVRHPERAPCPCWQALTERVAPLPSSTRQHHQPDTLFFVWCVDRWESDVFSQERQRGISSAAAVRTQPRLQSLLCVWII